MAHGNAPRVRFAPSPTGTLHLGNVRAALLNALYARQHNGTFIVRIEDTDAKRTVDPAAQAILEHLAWLGISYDEGPYVGGPHAPYYQSQRHATYEHFFNVLYEKGYIYRCFETPEELEQKRAQQRALGLPPRYGREGLKLSEEEIAQKLANKTPYVWRVKLPDTKISIYDLARGTIEFDLEHFGDFAITRQDGSFTFLFANFVDDYVMQISHIFRGEDHLSNSAMQAALYYLFNTEQPTFYHLPIITNDSGKKLSKRDFGFSLQDLRESGFLPEAICNYLAILGSSFEQEIMDFSELIQHVHINKHSPVGTIHYDVEKLRWVNQQWIQQLDAQDVAQRCRPFLETVYPDAQQTSDDVLIDLVHTLQTDLVTLYDVVTVFAFYFTQPEPQQAWLDHFNINEHRAFIETLYTSIDWSGSPDATFTAIKQTVKDADKPMKSILSLLRLALTGQPQGPGIKQLLHLLPEDSVRNRIQQLL